MPTCRSVRSSHLACSARRQPPAPSACSTIGPPCRCFWGWIQASGSGRTALAFAIRDAFPVSPGHSLVIPRRVVATWWDATIDEQHAIIDLLDAIKRRVDAEFAPDGYNIGVNAGEAAGQTVPHLHVHLIPRYDGDMDDPRGGVRHVIPGMGNYLAPPIESGSGCHVGDSVGRADEPRADPMPDPGRSRSDRPVGQLRDAIRRQPDRSSPGRSTRPRCSRPVAHHRLPLRDRERRARSLPRPHRQRSTRPSRRTRLQRPGNELSPEGVHLHLVVDRSGGGVRRKQQPQPFGHRHRGGVEPRGPQG